MSKRSRDKGKAGERELAAELRRIGFTDARRGVQYQGGPDSPDVCGIDGIHIESKRTERLHLYDALDQAMSEAPDGCVPVVAHRPNGRGWVLVVPLDLGVSFACRWLRALGYGVLSPSADTLARAFSDGEAPDAEREIRDAIKALEALP